MKCPHCSTSIHESWSDNNVNWWNGHYAFWTIGIMKCPECSEEILRLGRSHIANNEITGPNYRLVHPIGSTRGAAPKDVPRDISADYTEAALVLSFSPKASAALSRRCLQSVLHAAGYTQKDLSKQIDAVLAESDTKKALPSGVHMIVDAIRNFGNFAAHKITDQTSLQVIDVEPAEAEYCLDVLDSVFDHYYVRLAQARAIKDALNAKLAAANKPPIK